MRVLFGALLLLHAAAHGLAFASACELDPGLARSYVAAFHTGEQGTRLLGLCWAALGTALSVASVASVLGPLWWPAYTACVLVASLALCAIEWPLGVAPRIGVLVNVVLLALLGSSHLLDLAL